MMRERGRKVKEEVRKFFMGNDTVGGCGGETDDVRQFYSRGQNRAVSFQRIEEGLVIFFNF